MGVPALFRWLQKQYPKILTICVEEPISDPSELSNPNPNTIGDREFDCLYLDMNGIIHPAFHPQNHPAPKTLEEVYSNIEKYINRIFNIVRPRQILFMAIDGVAPRAKMNQQRCRRFRAAKESEYSAANNLKQAQELNDTEKIAIYSDPEYLRNHDTNIITPGTEFMDQLSIKLREFIRKQQETIPAWHNISVVLSDSSVPGEGEHKIMDFVRSQRISNGYDGNRRHCIYGLDADLIFLSLSCHEIYFTVLREDVFEEHSKKENLNDVGPNSFIFATIWILRQYLLRDLKPSFGNPVQKSNSKDKKKNKTNIQSDFEFNLENAIDDLIFLLFTIGNDFLPQCPGLNIQSGIISQVITEYCHKIQTLGGYILENGKLNASRFFEILRGIQREERAAIESILFPDSRAITLQNDINRICDSESPVVAPKLRCDAYDKEADRDSLHTHHSQQELIDLYYERKFGISYSNQDEKQAALERRQHIVEEYIKGMVWTWKYYSKGVASWSWYYPYDFAPLISDFFLADVETIENIEFEIGVPFPPLMQLMSVLPPLSAHCLPPALQNLMVNDDSPIKDFYPKTFRVDLNGAMQRWKGVVLLPFIDENRLKEALSSIELNLTPEEERRNKFGVSELFAKLPPSTHRKRKISGPVIWGKVTLLDDSNNKEDNEKNDNNEDNDDINISNEDDNCHWYSFKWDPPSNELDLSFVLLDVEQPPNCIKKVPTNLSRKAIQPVDPLLPLQAPGISPGHTLAERQKRAVNESIETPKKKEKESGFSSFLF